MEPLPATGYDVLRLDPDFDGSCPCATFTFRGHRFEAHCWRGCSQCEYVGLHYDSSGKALALELAALLTAMDWYGGGLRASHISQSFEKDGLTFDVVTAQPGVWPVRQGLRAHPSSGQGGEK